MKVRTRVTILFTLITASILMVFATIIYITAKENREKEFYASLKKEAFTKANLFLNAKVDAKTLQTIYRNNRAILNEVEVAIYDTGFHLLYHDAVDIDFVKETKLMMDNIIRNKEWFFYQQDWQVAGLLFSYGNQNYIITAAAYDQYGYSKLYSLRKNIILVSAISLLIIFAAGLFFSKKAFLPIREMTAKARDISATNLDLRINTNGSKDELSELANTFNEMLDRLENSFDAQKQFVSNISHELRTPLSTIITELELSCGKERSIEEYKSAISNALGDAKKLAKLATSLLDFAKASYHPTEISFKPSRIDEIILDARQQVQQANANYKIDIHFETDFEDDNQISINGNEYLLKAAFINLLENGCKFSGNQQCLVAVSFTGTVITLQFIDKGIGIPAKDLKNIFTPFYRGDNKNFAEGNGVGLSLAQKIIFLHKGSISVASNPGEGTIFTIELPHL